MTQPSTMLYTANVPLVASSKGASLGSLLMVGCQAQQYAIAQAMHVDGVLLDLQSLQSNISMWVSSYASQDCALQLQHVLLGMGSALKAPATAASVSCRGSVV